MKKLKVVIASDSFKGSASSKEVNSAIAKGVKSSGIPVEIVEVPIADGGEGTIEAIIENGMGELKSLEMDSALGENKKIHYGILKDNKTAVIETAETLGLTRMDKNNLDPSIIDSESLGELILFLLDQGIRKFYVGLGGSATNDCGYGMLKALGIKFLDSNGEEIKGSILELEGLERTDSRSLDPRISESEFILLADVKNSLCGEKGATYTYGPQKGIKDEDLQRYDEILCKMGRELEKELKKEFIHMPSTGAAGGLGAAFIGPLKAKTEPGIVKILELISFEEKLKEADLIITGEGKMDHQSIYGKAPMGILEAGIKYNIPVIAVVGSMGEGIEAVYEKGMKLILSILPGPMSLEEAIENTEENLKRAGYQAVKAFMIRHS